MNSEKFKSPREAFKNPQEVLRASDLSAEQKVKLLEQWKQEESLLQTATAENMSGGEVSIIKEVNIALTQALEEWKSSKADSSEQ